MRTRAELEKNPCVHRRAPTSSQPVWSRWQRGTQLAFLCWSHSACRVVVVATHLWDEDAVVTRAVEAHRLSARPARRVARNDSRSFRKNPSRHSEQLSDDETSPAHPTTLFLGLHCPLTVSNASSPQLPALTTGPAAHIARTRAQLPAPAAQTTLPVPWMTAVPAQLLARNTPTPTARIPASVAWIPSSAKCLASAQADAAERARG